MDELTNLLPLAFILLFGLGSILIILRLMIEKRIEQFHPKEWEKLGKPRMFSGEPDLNTKFVAYLNKNEFGHLKDEKLELMNRIAGTLSWLGIPLFLAVVILFLAVWEII